MKLSVIVPIYNAEKYLKRCLDSLKKLDQDMFEFILINDGSSDNSREICKNYVYNDGRFKLVEKDNGGVSSARNLGLKYATGDWVTFVDSDDYLDDNANNLIKRYIDKNVDAVFYGFEIISSKPNDVKKIKKMEKIILFSKEEIFKLKKKIFDCSPIISDVHIDLRSACGKLYNLEIIKSNNMTFDEKLIIGEDMCFNLEYLNSCKSVKYVNDIIYNYFMNEESAIHKYQPNINEKLVLLHKKLKKNILSEEVLLKEYKLYVLNDIFVMLKSDFFNRNSIIKNDRAERNRLKQIINNDGYSEIYNICTKSEIKDRFCLMKRIIITLSINGNYFILKQIYKFRYLIGYKRKLKKNS